MKRVMSLVAVFAIAAGTIELAGCQPNQPANSSGPNSAMSGGNGEFGESPAYPGSYSGNSYSTSPTAQPTAYH